MLIISLSKNIKIMKNLIFILCFFWIYPAFSQKEQTKKVETKISSLVIYLEGAEITRTKRITLKKGRNRLIFKNLSPKLNAQSLRVSVPPNLSEKISVLATSSKTNYLSKIKEKPKIKELKDSLKITENKIALLKTEEEAFIEEKDLIIKNKKIGGVNNGVNITELKNAADFFRSRLSEINKKIYSIKNQNLKLNNRKYKFKQQLRQLNAKLSYSRSVVDILLSAEMPITTEVTLKYFVYNAGWSPSYDIIAKDINQEVELIYRAKVFNNTDIDWKNAKIKLSTADPNLSASFPELKPWYLKYSQASYGRKAKGYYNSQVQGLGIAQNSLNWSVNDEKKEEAFSNQNIATNKNNFTEVELAMLNAEFDIKNPYTIPSDNKPYLVDVTEYKLPANYKHYAVPKMKKDAFLLARIGGWQDLNLVEGPANVYFSGTYIGQSYISTRNVKDSLDLSLGRDKRILVTRTKLKQYSSTQFIGSKVKETYAFKMIVRNNRKNTIHMTVLEQIPVSQNSEIEVKAIETSDAEPNITTGEVKWEFTLKPGNTKELKITYSIKHPKNTSINIKQSQKRRMRKF